MESDARVASCRSDASLVLSADASAVVWEQQLIRRTRERRSPRPPRHGAARDRDGSQAQTAVVGHSPVPDEASLPALPKPVVLVGLVSTVWLRLETEI